MKKIVFILAMSIFGTAVAYSQTEPAKPSKAEQKMPAHAKAKAEGKAKPHGNTKKMAAKMYECPMKCVAATDKPGKCPKCKMDLVEVKPKAKGKGEHKMEHGSH